MHTPTQLDRYRGAMVGTLCGDALSAPVEWWSPQEVEAYFREKGGYVLHDYLDPWAIRQGRTPRTVSAGQPTDDSELAAALAQSILHCKGLDESDLYLRLRNFIHGNTPLGRQSILTKKAYGKGGTLSDALQTPLYRTSLQRFSAGEIKTPPINGSLMRCIGIPLLAFRDSAVLTDLARRQSWVTHRNPTSVAACIAFSLMVSRVLMGMSPKRAWSHAKLELESHHSPSDSAMREILAIEPSRPDYELEMKGREGWVALSLRVALWASIEAENFEDGIQKAISVGGDTDTYAAIAGGILGAHVGLEGIPLQWRALLQGRAIMESLADGLFGLAHPEFDRR